MLQWTHVDEASQKFRFGPHPKGWLWSLCGNRVIGDDGTRTVDESRIEIPTQYEMLLLSKLEWREMFKVMAIDYLLDEHSSGTVRALQQMQNSQFMRAILETDGLANELALDGDDCV